MWTTAGPDGVEDGDEWPWCAKRFVRHVRRAKQKLLSKWQLEAGVGSNQSEKWVNEQRKEGR